MIDDVKRALEALREPVWGEPVRVVNDRLRTAALMIENMIGEHERTQRTIVCLTLQIADLEKKCSEWKETKDALAGMEIMLTSAQSAAETYRQKMETAIAERDRYWKWIVEMDCETCSGDCSQCDGKSGWVWSGENQEAGDEHR